MELKKYTRLSLLIALSVVLNLIESVIPIFNGFIPGLKLGLANIVNLLVLYKYSLKDCLYVAIIRVIVVGILRTGIFSVSFFLSLSGTLVSIFMMGFFKKITKLSIVGISVLGSICHSLGQLVMAAFLIHNHNIVSYAPYLVLFSIPTGIIIGLIANSCFYYLEDNK